MEPSESDALPIARLDNQRLRNFFVSLTWQHVHLYTRLTSPKYPTDRLAIAVHSFDGYRRFWGPAAYYNGKNLPDEIPRFFVSEEIPESDSGFDPLLTGKGDFVTRLLFAARAIQRLGFRFLLYLQEDQWLTHPLSHREILELVEVMQKHRLEILKLGEETFWPSEFDSIASTTDVLEEIGPASRFRWFGKHYYGMAHHISIFDLSFLIESLRTARLFREVRPVRHEIFCSTYLRPRMKATNHDNRRHRIAVWDSEPTCQYVHASHCGNLTEEAETLLARDGLLELYRPDLPGEIFPTSR